MKEVEAIRDYLDSTGRPPIEYFLNVFDTSTRIISPHIIVVGGHGYPECILIGRIEEREFTLKIGTRVLYTTKGRVLLVMKDGIIGNDSFANCKSLILELLRSLKNNEADMVYMADMGLDSDMYSLGMNLPSVFSRDTFPEKDNHWRLTLPPSREDFYRGRKRRRNLKNMKKRLDREFPGRTLVKRLSDSHEIESFCRDAEKVSKRTYQYAHGGGFVRGEGTGRLVKSLFERNMLLFYILYIEGEPCSFYVGFVHENVLHLTYTGYDPGCKTFDVGTVLLMKIIEDAIDREDIQYVDFGYSETPQKRRFCDLSWEVRHLVIFRLSIKGFLLKGMRVFNSVTSRTGRYLMGLFRIRERYDRYKRYRIALREE